MAPAGETAQLVGGARPPAPPKKDNGGLVFLILLVTFAVWFTWKMKQQAREIEAQIKLMGETLKRELPPLFLVGEGITRADLDSYRDRIERLEAMTRNLESRLNRSPRSRPGGGA